jgi:thiamine biosynthesis lipoprotein
MGTVFSIDIRDGGDWSAALADVVDWLHLVDATFSTYRPESAVSRLRRGELAVTDCPPDVAHVIAECEALAARTDGYFSAQAAGTFDPSGYVKGWAIERASDRLRERGSSNHTVNGGGDMQCAGCRAPGEPWRVGISDPLHPGQLAAVVEVRDGAVATSGNAERGAHVIDPKTGLPATELASVTIVGAHLRTVDAYATAALAMGHGCRTWLQGLDDVEALVIATDGSRWTTDSFGKPLPCR